MPNWKKLIVSGSSPSFKQVTVSNNITGSGNLEIKGNVSGSVNTTGSFGFFLILIRLRKSSLKFQGYESDTANTMAEIVASHSGTSADYKGMIKFNVNDGNDADGSLQPIMKLGPSTQIRTNTAQNGGNNTITLDASASGTDDFYNGYLIQITGGTGVGQLKKITEF